MSRDYEAPDPDLGDFVHRTNMELEEDARRLEHALPEELKTVIRDKNATRSARMNALMYLRIQKDPEFVEVALDLFEDPDQQLWHAIHPSKVMLQDFRLRQKYLKKLDGPDLENSGEAAIALAFAGDASLIPRFTNWLNQEDEPRRNIAIEALRLLKLPDSLTVLQQFWVEGKGDEETRLSVAGALLDSGDLRGRNFLEAIAQRAEGLLSVAAATLVYVADRSNNAADGPHRKNGLKLMLHVLNAGDLAAKHGMVNQIWNFEGLPHAFTADGCDEARVWIRSQLQLAST